MTEVWSSYTATNQFSSANAPVTAGDWETAKVQQVTEQQDQLANFDDLWANKAKVYKGGFATLSVFDILEDMEAA